MLISSCFFLVDHFLSRPNAVTTLSVEETHWLTRLTVGIFFRIKMIKSAILFAFICSVTIPVILCVQCGEKNCTQICIPAKQCAAKFDCGASTEKCTQFCTGSSSKCSVLTCPSRVNDCRQHCIDCPTETKLTCSSETCSQDCSGPNCVMECTKDVKVCKQICAKNSACNMTCSESSKCGISCPDSSTCNFVGKHPPTAPPGSTDSQCDKNQCVKNCSGSCKDQILKCEETKSCSLSCTDGCTMVCKDTVNKCKMNCIGQSSCKMECNAKSCSKYQNGKEIIKSAGSILHSQTLYVLVLALLVLDTL